MLTLGPPAAEEQLRERDGDGHRSGRAARDRRRRLGAEATAGAIADAVRDEAFDLLLFGNESADNGNYQVAVRVAHALGLPCVTGIKG